MCMISYLYLCIIYIYQNFIYDHLYTFITLARRLHWVSTFLDLLSIFYHCYTVLCLYYSNFTIYFSYLSNTSIQSSITITGTITLSMIVTCITPQPISLTLCIPVCCSSNVVNKHYVTSLICSTPVTSNLITWLKANPTIQFCEQRHALIYARE